MARVGDIHITRTQPLLGALSPCVPRSLSRPPYLIIGAFLGLLWLVQPSAKEVRKREQAVECMEQVRLDLPTTACH